MLCVFHIYAQQSQRTTWGLSLGCEVRAGCCDDSKQNLKKITEVEQKQGASARVGINK